jgi:hypothetical protein
MICRKENEQQIKRFVTDVRMRKGDSLVWKTNVQIQQFQK